MRAQRGAVLVEFALMALVLFLILAAVMDFGRLFLNAQAVQDAARVAARELALMPLPACWTLDMALGVVDPDPMVCPTTTDPALVIQAVQRQIFDERLLVIDTTGMTQDQMDTCLGELPVVNKALLPVMMSEQLTVGDSDRIFLRYPGALLQGAPPADLTGVYTDCNAVDGFFVGIPEVTSRAGSAETIRWLPVLEEIIQNPADVDVNGNPLSGSFDVTPRTNPDTMLPYIRGVAAIRVNFPFQGALLSGFRAATPTADDPLPPNIGNVIPANDGVTEENGVPHGGAIPATALPEGQAGSVYAGPYGLGRQIAFVQEVRPFRKLFSAQAIFRREVFE